MAEEEGEHAFFKARDAVGRLIDRHRRGRRPRGEGRERDDDAVLNPDGGRAACAGELYPADEDDKIAAEDVPRGHGIPGAAGKAVRHIGWISELLESHFSFWEVLRDTHFSKLLVPLVIARSILSPVVYNLVLKSCDDLDDELDPVESAVCSREDELFGLIASEVYVFYCRCAMEVAFMLLIVKANNMRIHVDYGRKVHHSAKFPHRDTIEPTRHGWLGEDAFWARVVPLLVALLGAACVAFNTARDAEITNWFLIIKIRETERKNGVKVEQVVWYSTLLARDRVLDGICAYLLFLINGMVASSAASS